MRTITLPDTSVFTCEACGASAITDILTAFEMARDHECPTPRLWTYRITPLTPIAIGGST